MRAGAWKVEINFSTERAPLSQRGAAVTRQRVRLGCGSVSWWLAVGVAGGRLGRAWAGAARGR